MSGHPLRWRRVNGLLLTEIELAPGQRVHRDQDANHRFVLVVRGALAEVRDGEPTSHPASTLLFRPAREALTYEAGPRGATCLIVDMEHAWFHRAQQQAAGILTRAAEFRGGLVLHLAQRLYGEFRLRDEVSRLAIESLTLGVLAEASRRAALDGRRAGAALVPLWLVHARAFIDAHFAERLAIATIAAAVGVHPVHLARSFRRVYRTTIGAYVREVRIDFARQQLATSALPICAIAADAGFCDQSHFCRLFKRHLGMSPAEYRTAVRVC
jgi:AraC family transcriptional regulator